MIDNETPIDVENPKKAIDSGELVVELLDDDIDNKELLSDVQNLLDDPVEYIWMQLKITNQISAALKEVLEFEETEQKDFDILWNIKIDFLDKYIDYHPDIDSAIKIIKKRWEEMYSVRFEEEKITDGEYRVVCKGVGGEIFISIKELQDVKDFTVNFQVYILPKGNLSIHMKNFKNDIIGLLKERLNLEVIDSGNMKLYDDQEAIIKYSMYTKIDSKHFDHLQAKKALMSSVANKFTIEDILRKRERAYGRIKALSDKYKDVDREAISEAEENSLLLLEGVLTRLRIDKRKSERLLSAIEVTVEELITTFQLDNMIWSMERKQELLSIIRWVMPEAEEFEAQITKLDTARKEVKKEVEKLSLWSKLTKLFAKDDN